MRSRLERAPADELVQRSQVARRSRQPKGSPRQGLRKSGTDSGDFSQAAIVVQVLAGLLFQCGSRRSIAEFGDKKQLVWEEQPDFLVEPAMPQAVHARGFGPVTIHPDPIRSLYPLGGIFQELQRIGALA